MTFQEFMQTVRMPTTHSTTEYNSVRDLLEQAYGTGYDQGFKEAMTEVRESGDRLKC